MTVIPRGRSEQIALAIGLALLVILIAAAYLVVRPFLSSLLWGMILAIGTWPLYQRLRDGLGGRRTLAAALLVLLFAAILVVPLWMVGQGFVDHVNTLTQDIRQLLQQGPPPPPQWLHDVPFVGDRAVAFWDEIAQGGAKAMDLLRRSIQPVSSWLLGAAGSIGQALGETTLSLIAVFFFYRDGESAAVSLLDLLTQVAGEQARRLLSVAHRTVQSVVYGIVGSALAQSILAGIGFSIAGIPGAFPLTVATFFVSLLPTGAFPVWLPVTIWVFAQDSTEWGIFLVAWNALLTGQIDNFIKPYFIARGSPLPLLLVFIGVLGGAIAFGFLGLFLGPTVLAVLFVLMREWAPDRSLQATTASPAAAKDG